MRKYIALCKMLPISTRPLQTVAVFQSKAFNLYIEEMYLFIKLHFHVIIYFFTL